MKLLTCLRVTCAIDMAECLRRVTSQHKKAIALLSATFCIQNLCYAGDEWTMTSVGPWNGVGSMSVSQTEDYMVFSQMQSDGSEQAFETRCSNGIWTDAKPIASLNQLGTVGGLFLTDDCRHMYFHAKTDDASGYDIYTSDYANGQWGNPKRIADLCTSEDEMYPSVAEGNLEIYFLRHQTVSDARAEKKAGDKMSIYHAQIDNKGKWSRILPINPAISFGYVQTARIMRDGGTLLYSTRPEKKDKARPVFTRETVAEQWLLPEYMNEDDGKDFLCLQNAGQHLYLILPDNKKSNYGTIFRTKLPTSKYSSKEMATETGKIISKENGVPVEATIEVRNPTSNDLIGQYKTSTEDGAYNLVSDPSGSYIISARAEGYSYFSKLVNYNGSAQPQLPATITLFDTTTVGITLYDNDIYQPIDGKVIAVRQSDKAIFRAKKGGRDGWSSLRLPIGGDYNIIATAKGFGESKFLFKSSGDLVFDHFERELPMSPVRRTVNVKIYDDKTMATISTAALFKSQDRDEKMELASGKTSISLREGDKYTITVHPQGYMFANVQIDLQKYQGTTIEIPLTALVTGANLQLHDIIFDTNEAFLRPESYAELDRLVRLMNVNPDLKVDIQAHTDNVGRAASNMALSSRRAQSVVQYLLENGIDGSRLKSRGFGMSKPIASNDTEEGRQKNRRVEILVIE